MSDKARWYVAHTYSGYENKVKANLEKAIENRGMHDMIVDISVPVEEVLEIKDDKKKLVQRKIFPGYVLVKMVMTDDSWYVVRNCRGVTGFVGPGSKPVPLTDEEVAAMGVEKPVQVSLDFKEGDNVRVNHGALEGFIGTVEKIDMEKKKVRCVVSMFGRDTIVELEFHQVETPD